MLNRDKTMDDIKSGKVFRHFQVLKAQIIRPELLLNKELKKA